MEGIVIRYHRVEFGRRVRFAIGIAAMLVLGLQICPAVRSQDPPPAQTPPPSLGDVARKYREEKAAQDKNQATAKNTFTNDGLVSGKSGSLLGSGVADVAGNHGADSGSAFEKAVARMDEGIRNLDMLGAMDHDTLFKTATQGIVVDFPGRKAWENQMLAARQNYVVHGRELLQSTKGLFMEAKALHDAQGDMSPNDPRVKSFVANVQMKIKEAERLEADFKAVVEEGHERALQAAGH
jgi:hypothetical protein